MRIKFINVALSAFFILYTGTNAIAGVVVGGTRVVYHLEDKEESLRISNPDKSLPYLIQSWVDDNGVKGDQKKNEKPPFIITPPLFRINPGDQNDLRIIRAGGAFSTEKETMYWLNIKSIPANPKSSTVKNNSLQVSVKTRIKLIVRPEGLTSDPSKESENLKFNRSGDVLTVSNPTGYYMTFYKLSIGDVSLDTIDNMVSPKGTSTYKIPTKTSSNSLVWQVINDKGGVSNPKSQELK